MDRNTSSHSTVSRPLQAPAYLNLWQIVRRRKWRIVFAVVVCLSLAAAYCLLKGPFYQSTAQILVVKKQLQTAPISGPNQQQPQQDDYLATHMLVITSPRIVEDAIQKNDLQSLACFKGKDDLSKEIGDALLVSRDAQRPGLSPSNEILNLTFRGTVPEECNTVLNALIASYQQFWKQTYRNVNSEALELIAKARDVLRKDVSEKEAAYRDFRKNTAPLWKGKEGITLHQDRLFNLDARISNLRVRQVEIEATLGAIEKVMKERHSQAELLNLVSGSLSGRDTQVPTVATTSDPRTPGRNVRATVEEEFLNLQLEESKLLERYGDGHPDVQGVRQRLTTVRALMTPAADASSSLQEIVNLRVQLLKRELDESKRAEKSLAAIFDADQHEAKTAIIHEIEDEAHRQGIERSKLLYESVLKRLQELESVRDYGGYDTHILGLPAPELALRKYALVLGLVLAVGLVFGFGWAYLADLSDQSFRTPNEIRERLGLPVLGQIPALTGRLARAATNGKVLDRLLCTYHSPMSDDAEAYRSVRSALYFGSSAQASKVIQITSPNQGDGKTTVAANLAVSIAQSGKSVLLIDADFREPRLHAVYGLSNDVGLASVLSDAADPAQAVCKSEVPGLSVLPAGPLPANPAELLTSPRLRSVLDAFRQQYDYVLIDTSPLLACADAQAVASRADGVLLTLRMSRHARPDCERTKEILDLLATNTLGVVVNGVDRRSLLRSYGYDGNHLGVTN